MKLIFGDTNKKTDEYCISAGRRWLGRTWVAEMWRLHLSDNKNSLLPPPPNLLSGCHGSNRGGEWGSSRDCKWESTPLSNLCLFSTPVHPPALLSVHFGQFDCASFVLWRAPVGMVSVFICKMNIFPIFNTDLFSYPLLCSSAPASQYWKIFVVLGSFQVPQVQLAHASLARDGSGHIWAEPAGRCELLTSAVWATSCLHYLCDAWANLHVQLACQVEHVRSLLVTTSDYCFLANDTFFFHLSFWCRCTIVHVLSWWIHAS